MSWLGDFLNNAKLVETAFNDVRGNLNPLDPRFLSGDAWETALEVERQKAEEEGREISGARVAASAEGGIETIKQAAYETAEEVAEEVADTTKAAFTWGPWIVGGILIAGVALAAVIYLPKPRG